MPTTSRAAVELVIKARDDASKTLKQFGGSLKDIEREAAIAGAALVGIGAAGLALSRSFLQSAVQNEQLARSFGNLSESIGSTADALLTQMHDATLGALSDAESMLSANQMIGMGLAETAQEAAGMAEMAVTLGAAFGKEATPALEQFTLMMANQSILRLDWFGISAAKVRVRILELQAATKGMSREEAFKIAVMEEGRRSMKRVGDVTDNTALAISQAQAAIRDLSAEMGTYLLPAARDVAIALRDAVGALKEWPEWAQKGAAYSIALGSALTAGSGALLLLVAGFDKAKTAAIALWSILQTVGSVVIGIVPPIAALIALLDLESSQSRTLQGDLAAMEVQIRETAGSYDEYISSLELALTGLEAFYKANGITATEVELLDRGIAMSREEFEALTPVVEAATQAITDSGQQLEEWVQQSAQQLAKLRQLTKEELAELAAIKEDMIRREANALSIAQDAYRQLAMTVATAGQQAAQAAEQYAWDRQVAEIQAMQSTRQAFAQHYQLLAAARARFETDVLRLQQQGKVAELANLRRAHEEEIANIEWRFDTAQAQASTSYKQAEAWAEVHYARQQYLQAVAHKEQLEGQLSYYAEEARIWLIQNQQMFENQTVLYSYLIDVLAHYHESAITIEGQAANAHIELERIKAEATRQGAEATINALAKVVLAYQAVIEAAAGAIGAAKADIAAALAGIKDIKIELPPPPDWSAFIPDLAPAFQKISSGAKKATQEVSRVVTDFSNMISDAINALVKLAGFETLETLGDGAAMFEDALRSLIPMLRRLDDALDAAISRAGMDKVQIFADTIGKLASAVSSMRDLGASAASITLGGFENLLMSLPPMFRALDDSLDAFISRAGMEKIGIFADTIQKFGVGLEALEGLASYVAPDNWGRALSDLAAVYEGVVRHFAEVSGMFSLTELSRIENFSATLEQLGSALSVAVAGLEDLSIYKGAANLADQALRFRLDMLTVLGEVKLLAAEYVLESASVGDFTEIVGSIGRMLSAAVDGLTNLGAYERVRDFDSALSNFAADLEYVLEVFASWVSGPFVGLADEATVAFAGAVGEIFGGIGTAVDVLQGIADFAQGEGSFEYALQRFNEAVTLSLQSWDTWLVGTFTPEALAAVMAFWDVAKGIFDGLSGAVDSLTRISEFAGVPQEVFDQFAMAMRAALDVLLLLASEFDADTISAAGVIWSAANALLEQMRAAVEAMRVVIEYALEWRTLYDELARLLDVPSLPGEPAPRPSPPPPPKGYPPPPPPRLQHGGIVTRPTLAILGEAGPEAVIPLSRAGGAGTRSHITVDVRASGFTHIDREQAMEIARALALELRLQGVRA